LFSYLFKLKYYSFIFKNHNLNKTTDFHYFRWNFEVAGNLLSLYSHINKNVKPDSGSYTLFHVPYSQYVSNDIDYHYFHVVNDASQIVYRLYAGVAFPYGNSVSLPYEKQFFSGGALSIRGWQPRKLGPGSYVDTISKYPNSTGDIKLEANIEYRFKLFWVLEGAFFVDAGNIWAISPKDQRTGALFEWNKFYKEIAISPGAGIRFSFPYFLFRFDVGSKMRDPGQVGNQRWIFNRGKPTWENGFAWSVAIGYPF